MEPARPGHEAIDHTGYVQVHPDTDSFDAALLREVIADDAPGDPDASALALVRDLGLAESDRALFPALIRVALGRSERRRPAGPPHIHERSKGLWPTGTPNGTSSCCASSKPKPGSCWRAWTSPTPSSQPGCSRSPTEQMTGEARVAGRAGCVCFFQLVSARFERASFIVTSNKPFGCWGEVFGDDVVRRRRAAPPARTGIGSSKVTPCRILIEEAVGNDP
jgi:hypothetical protein